MAQQSTSINFQQFFFEVVGTSVFLGFSVHHVLVFKNTQSEKGELSAPLKDILVKNFSDQAPANNLMLTSAAK